MKAALRLILFVSVAVGLVLVFREQLDSWAFRICAFIAASAIALYYAIRRK